MLKRHVRLPQGLKPRIFSVLNGTAEAVPFPKAVPFPRHLRFASRFPAFPILPTQVMASAFLLCSLVILGVTCEAQSPADNAPTEGRPRADLTPADTIKADIIFEHGNIYTGVPANAQFSSILREEAIAVRGDRIQAVGKNADIEKLKGRSEE